MRWIIGRVTPPPQRLNSAAAGLGEPGGDHGPGGDHARPGEEHRPKPEGIHAPAHQRRDRERGRQGCADEAHVAGVFGGPRRNRLFITATTSLYAIHVGQSGVV